MYWISTRGTHQWYFGSLMFLVILGNLTILGTAYYISQIAFADMVIELQFTAFQGAAVIENSSAIWRQAFYGVAFSIVNTLLLGIVWHQRIFAKIVRLVSTYWILGMTLLTLTTLLYYTMLVIQINA
jgi:hypothetical protein